MACVGMVTRVPAAGFEKLADTVGVDRLVSRLAYLRRDFAGRYPEGASWAKSWRSPGSGGRASSWRVFTAVAQAVVHRVAAIGDGLEVPAAMSHALGVNV